MLTSKSGMQFYMLNFRAVPKQICTLAKHKIDENGAQNPKGNCEFSLLSCAIKQYYTNCQK